MKHVYANRELFHQWAYEQQEWARNHNDTMSFRNGEAYSYRAMIAKIIRNERGEKAFLISTRSWSSTTGQHQSHLRRSIPSDATIFYLHDISRVKEDALLEIRQSISELALQAKRARSYKPYRLRDLQEKVEMMQKFCAFFDLPVPQIPEDTDAIIAAGQEYLRQYETEKRVREEAAQRQREIDNKDRIDAWRRGENDYAPYMPYSALRLSVNGNRVETSNGAEVPTSHVRRVAPFLLDAIDRRLKGEKVQVPAIRLGVYTVQGIEADGTLVVGCHRFRADEIRNFADVLARADVQQDTEEELQIA